MSLSAAIIRAGGLLSAADLARDFGLTRQRLTVLQRAESFPEPVGTVNGRPVWAGNEAREWRENQLALAELAAAWAAEKRHPTPWRSRRLLAAQRAAAPFLPKNQTKGKKT